MIIQIIAAGAAAILTTLILNIPAIRQRLWRLAIKTRYRVESSPKRIEKNLMAELEAELQQILVEERKKDEIKSRRAHPAGRRRPDIDNSTKRIISDVTRPGNQDNQDKKSKKNNKSAYYPVDPQFNKNWKWPEPPKRG